MKKKDFTISFLGLGISTLFLYLILFNGLSIAQKIDGKAKKKLYISTIKANGAPTRTANRLKEGIRLAIFEDYGDKYHVFDDDSIKVMYKQAEAIMTSGSDDTSYITQIADGINADEIVYGDVLQEETQIKMSITDLERKGSSFGTKSIVNLSFLESQIDYAASEAAKKIVDPGYKIDMNKAPIVQEVKLGGIEIKEMKGLDISIIQFKSKDETAERIIQYSKNIITEGDVFFNKKQYSNARYKYLDIIDRVQTTLSEGKQTKIKEYIDGVHKRIESTYIMEFKPAIDRIDEELQVIKELKESDLEKELKKYSSLEEDIKKIPYQYKKELLNAINDRKDRINIIIVNGYEKNANILYHDYKFFEAIKIYEKADKRISKINNEENKNNASERITKKINTIKKTGQSFLVNRLKSLVDKAEFYNFQRNTLEAKNVMKEARELITGPMKIFATRRVVETFNNYADVMKIRNITEKDEPEILRIVKNQERKEMKQMLEEEKIADFRAQGVSDYKIKEESDKPQAEDKFTGYHIQYVVELDQPAKNVEIEYETKYGVFTTQMNGTIWKSEQIDVDVDVMTNCYIWFKSHDYSGRIIIKLNYEPRYEFDISRQNIFAKSFKITRFSFED